LKRLPIVLEDTDEDYGDLSQEQANEHHFLNQAMWKIH
jgi:hypothetical protein